MQPVLCFELWKSFWAGLISHGLIARDLILLGALTIRLNLIFIVNILLACKDSLPCALRFSFFIASSQAFALEHRLFATHGFTYVCDTMVQTHTQLVNNYASCLQSVSLVRTQGTRPNNGSWVANHLPQAKVPETFPAATYTREHAMTAREMVWPNKKNAANCKLSCGVKRPTK